jgi:hypothetical protein
MTKEHLQLTEAFGKFNNVLNARLRFFIGGAIKDALVQGHRTDLLTEHEAQELLDVVEAGIMAKARASKEVQAFLAGANVTSKSYVESVKSSSDHIDMTPRQYYDNFIKPALDIIREEYSELIGSFFVKYICTGERPAEDALTEDEKLLWNVFMAMVEIEFNAELTAAISDTEA